ncbi:MAG: prepilin-type N-terminal cleavage/methylation domain-containing protein [Burkholderiaceae bacterium]|nr:MAG: prepilin-type N-terminal cleavage/methylation domain-containing protein [Burkholderiaceae bacterium]
MLRPSSRRGFTLIETMITITILAIIIAMAAPGFATWMRNLKIRSVAEKMLGNLQTARNEAIRRNTSVRFSLVTNLTSGCALSSAGTAAVVTVGTTSPAGACDTARIDGFSAAEGATQVTVAAVDAAAAAQSSVVFSGLGLVTTTVVPAMQKITLDSAPAGTYRKLQIEITPGGAVRMCDPAVIVATDPRICVF